MIYYYNYKSPIGSLSVIRGEKGLLKLAINKPAEIVLNDILSLDKSETKESYDKLADVIEQLDAYFKGKLQEFSVEIDLNNLSEFHKKVIMDLSKIPYGTVISYGELARKVNNPKAARAVGQACKANPIPIIIPCHRVIRSDGKIGNYTAGVDVKKYLLDLEKVEVKFF
jgi:methylated-DNA-[protein]-cysteine S-methyltransferase